MNRLLALPLILSACVASDVSDSKQVHLSPTEVTQIQATVVRDFFDPEAARFRNVRAADITLTSGEQVRRVCGEVNGKNRLGAYVGYSMFGGRIVNGSFVRQDFFGACE